MAKEYTPASRNREAFAAMTDTPGNVPPQAVELEEAVLGALMLEKDSIITVQEFITPEAFYTGRSTARSRSSRPNSNRSTSIRSPSG